MNKVRALVSGAKIRLQDGKFDLDLTYITERLIAMCLPGEGFRKVYRNDINHVAEFLKTNHGNNYMVFNLSEHAYDVSKFDGKVQHFEFPDHHAPRIARLLEIIHAMDKWLEEDEQHVAVVHCIAGKGRTGTIISCYLLYKGVFQTPEEALTYFAQKRTSNLSGVRVPSQIRYCNYFYAILKAAPSPPGTSPVLQPPAALPFILQSISFSQVPLWDRLEAVGEGLNLKVKVMQLGDRLPHKILGISTRVHKAHPVDSSEIFSVLELACPVAGDIIIKAYYEPETQAGFFEAAQQANLPKSRMVSRFGKRSIPIFRFTFHTAFMPPEQSMQFGLKDLDSTFEGPVDAPMFPSNFRICVYFSDPPPPEAPLRLAKPNHYENNSQSWAPVIASNQLQGYPEAPSTAFSHPAARSEAIPQSSYQGSFHPPIQPHPKQKTLSDPSFGSARQGDPPPPAATHTLPPVSHQSGQIPHYASAPSIQQYQHSNPYGEEPVRRTETSQQPRLEVFRNPTPSHLAPSSPSPQAGPMPSRTEMPPDVRIVDSSLKLSVTAGQPQLHPSSPSHPQPSLKHSGSGIKADVPHGGGMTETSMEQSFPKDSHAPPSYFMPPKLPELDLPPPYSTQPKQTQTLSPGSVNLKNSYESQPQAQLISHQHYPSPIPSRTPPATTPIATNAGPTEVRFTQIHPTYTQAQTAQMPAYFLPPTASPYVQQQAVPTQQQYQQWQPLPQQQQQQQQQRYPQSSYVWSSQPQQPPRY